MANRRRTNRLPASRSRRTTNGLGKFKKLSKLAVWIIPGIVVPVAVYWLTTAEPDIRYVCGSERVIEPLDKKYDQATGTTQLYFRIIDTFKNTSTKGGHIEKVEFTPIEIGVRPNIEVTHIDKENFAWREQRNIEVRFNITLTKEMSDFMAQNNKQMAMTMKAYDNTGKSLKVCDSDAPYSTTFNLSAVR
jgi:hypothetical protein